MTINVTVLPETGGASPTVRAGGSSTISAAGVNDSAAIARQQLPNAVPAVALVPAYAGNAVAPPKPPTKPLTSVPSSAFAAQLIGQSSDITAEDLAIFELHPVAEQPLEDAAPDDFLNAIRIARGDVAPGVGKEARAKKAGVVMVHEEVRQGAVAFNVKATGGLEQSLRASISHLAAGLPGLLAPLIKRPTILQVRGVSAYQLAETRNAAGRQPTTTQAVAP